MTPDRFGLNDRPFAVAPRAEHYVAVADTEQARLGLRRCLDRAEGIGVLIAGTGLGKTLLLQVLAGDLAERFAVIQIEGGQITTRRALLQAILYELQLPCVGRDEGDLRLTLLDRLSLPGDAGLVILCDEAHVLPLRLLEELRLLTNVVRDGEHKVRLLLAGTTQLEERLSNPKLEALQQRIGVRAYLHPWNKQETREYVRARIITAGGVPEQLFTSAALEAIHRACDGIPRLTAQLCDHALVLAGEQRRYQLDKADIEAAWADLQQLPPPQATISVPSTVTTAGMATVEFGVLDDDELIPPSVETESETAAASFEAGGPRLFAGHDDEIDGPFDDDTAMLNPPQAAPFRPRLTQPMEEESPVDSPIEVVSARTVESRLFDDLQAAETRLNELAAEFPQWGNGTEVELTWSEEHPFLESFLDEEIVLDPYLNQSFNIFADKPQVHMRPAVEPAPRYAVDTQQVTDRKTVVVSPVKRSPVVEKQTAPAASIELVYAAPISPAASVITAAPQPISPATGQQEHGSVSPPSTMTDEDQDLIVIEDGIETTAPSGPAVTRHEYRQLFAKLRRG